MYVDGNQIVFEGDDGGRKIDIHVEDDTIWLTQAQMAEIFSVTPNTISYHLTNIYKSGELECDETMRRIKSLVTSDDDGHQPASSTITISMRCFLSVTGSAPSAALGSASGQHRS